MSSSSEATIRSSQVDWQALANLPLGPGEPVSSNCGEQVAWIVFAGEDMSLCSALRELFPRSGIWPVWVEGVEGLREPWLVGDLDGLRGEPLEAETILRHLQGQDDVGLADPLNQNAPVPWADERLTEHLLLTPVSRPADVPWAIGWRGALTMGLDGTRITSLLRSWEDRYGAYLINLGPFWLTLQLTRSFAEFSDFERLASEHVAVCPDLLQAGPLEDFTWIHLPETDQWSFWWL